MTRSIRQRFATPEPEPRMRIICETVGPGKARLLRLIDETRSISEAARRMDMTYAHAWALLDDMNRCFKAPVVESAPGGKKGGGSKLTETGRRVIDLYEAICAKSLKASARDLDALHALLREVD